MSNLYKQYNTLEPERKVRMIDYNPLVEQKLAELAKQQAGGQTDEDGFRGLGDIAAQRIEEEDPAEVLQKAKEEAEAILSGAREEADALVADANAQSGDILQTAKEDGRKQGYDEGLAQAKEELETEYGRKKEELDQLERKLRGDYDQKLQDLEPKLLDVILTVVEKVFHIQFGDKREILLYLVDNALAGIEGCRSFRIRIGSEQKDFLEMHKDEILDRIGHDMSLEIVSDQSLSDGQCMIETDTGIFDCSLGVQLENLIKDLRSLSLRG